MLISSASLAFSKLNEFEWMDKRTRMEDKVLKVTYSNKKWEVVESYDWNMSERDMKNKTGNS